MNDTYLVELTNDEKLAVNGGQVNGFSCFAAGVIFSAGLVANWWAAASAAVYLYSNRDVCLH